MRRSLTRATAVCAAYALVLVLGAVAPATADEGVPTTADGSVAPGEPGAPGERSGGPRGSDPDAEGTSGPAGPGAASATDGPPAPARPHGARTEVESSSWTYVDRAFPDRPHGGAETASVGTGRLEWDRNYTRRALFRFPVAPGPGAVVDSAVLRTEVAWSYDCGSDSFVQLHRVDPFDEGTTWNDQPRARALLDTRRIRGGRSSCPVPGGVEFDLTEAYQRAVDAGEHHIHLRLGERDESGTTAWRRFDVEDHPPVLVVDRSAPPSPDATADPNALRSDPAEGAAGDGAPGVRAAVRGEGSPDPAPVRFTERLALVGVTAPGTRGDHDTRVPDLVSADRLPDGGERIRPRRGRRTGRPTAADGHRRRGGDTPPRVRGPPDAVRSETVSVHRS
ncbi:DNRLRE domain-containing protein [Nocardiopsis dassonvillei]|uniref:DNRLRE domain-containing protein n=1 Tax=Nocardiopsis dassonvillei TaxID=2014 RepID=UPI00200CF69D|nr:DNRLRE domain-containing protein [Nocardiopsis dassonvillei]MCK9873317.1 DNRLRE domain-containing protein [Nocardiopsis dassonvillei]